VTSPEGILLQRVKLKRAGKGKLKNFHSGMIVFKLRLTDFIILLLEMALVQHRWEKIVAEWLEGKTFVIPDAKNGVPPPPPKEEWDIKILMAQLVEKGIIPQNVAENATLYSLLLLQMEKQLILNLVVPRGVNGSFAGTINCKQMRLHKLADEIGKYMECFEKELV
jgi:hypothetical protein